MGELMDDALGRRSGRHPGRASCTACSSTASSSRRRWPRWSTPRSSGRASERRSMEEGCLSLPAVLVDVERPIHVRVRALDEHGEPILIEASGLEARVIQHEIDHLDGVLILDRTTREQRKEAMRDAARGRAGRVAVARRAHGLPRDLRVRRRRAARAWPARRTGRRWSSPGPTARAAGAAAGPAAGGRGAPASSGSSSLQPASVNDDAAREHDRRRPARGGVRVRVRRADQGAAAVGVPDAQRASVAAAALARGGADRAGDHGRRRAHRGVDHAS